MQKSPRILVADDREINRLVLGEILRRQGYEIIEAENGAEARKLAVDTAPDLILLDIMMPGEEGTQTCRLLKENPATADIPVIIVSALSDVTKKIESFDVGAVDYITKPFHAVEIAARVRLHLRLSRAQNELANMQAQRLAEIADAQREIISAPENDQEARCFVERRSLAEASGDFHDVIALSPRSYFYFVADVSGHGLKASYTTAALKALTSQNATAINTPQETLKSMNAVLHRILGEGNHVTGVCAVINRATEKVEVVCAGHPPAMRLSGNGAVTEIGAPGDPLGAYHSVVLHSQTIHANPGERIYLYTDGLIESEGRVRSEGSRLLAGLIKETATLSMAESVKEIFSRLASTNDDATLMGIEI